MSEPTASHPVIARRPVPGMVRAACIATLAAGGLLAGCERENPSSDAALAKIAEATAYRNAGDPNASATAAAAAVDAEASDAVQAVASELNADIAEQQAQDLIGRRGTAEQDPGLVITQTDALNQAFHLAQLASTVALTQTFIDAEQQTNPQPTLESISEKVSSIQSGETWSPTPSVDAQLATIAQVDEQISQLQSQVQSLEEKGASLTQQRSEALSQASELDAEVGLQEPAQAEQTDQQIRQLRDQAAQLTAEATLNNAELERLQVQISELQALKTALEEAVAALQSQAQTLSQSWDEVSAQIENLQTRRQNIYSGEAPSVTATGEALATTLERLATLEQDVLSLLDKAVSSLGDARGKASTAISGTSDDLRSAFQRTFDQNRHSLKLAINRRRQASVHIGSGAVHLGVLAAQRTLEGSGQTLPQSLGGDPSQAFVDAVQQAAEALTAALSDAQNAAASQGQIGRAATLQEALVLNDMLTLRQLVAGSGVQVTLDIPTEQELQSQISQVVSNARQSGVQLPPLPAFIAAGAVSPAETAPDELGGLGGEAPATQPATQPETPDAPPEAPAGDAPAESPDAPPAGDPVLNPGADPGLDPANIDDPA